MRRKLTISINEAVLDGLRRVAGPRRMGRFIEALVRPYVVAEDLDRANAQLAADQERNAEAEHWALYSG